jgi:hypothetical protein
MMMILSVSVTIPTIKCQSFVQTFYFWDGDRHWQYHHHLFRHFIVVMVTDTDNIIIICSDILLFGWWQTLTVSSSFVQTFYCWDGDRHWQYHHHLNVRTNDDTVSVCHHPNNKMSEQMMMILSVSVTIPTIKCLNKWWWYCQCLSPSQQ